jgi:hypothetical protein
MEAFGADRKWLNGLLSKQECLKYEHNGDGTTSNGAAFPPQRPRPRHTQADAHAQATFKANLQQYLEQIRQQHPEATVELWAFDEHRLGLKPIVRTVWAPIGERPIAKVNHRYQWLYVYGFVHPHTGRSEWFLLPRVNVRWFNAALAEFARAVGASAKRRIVLVIDNAGWHRSSQVVVPEGIHLLFLPPYSPELQPAERLWELVDEPLVNRSFETLDELEAVLMQRCQTLSMMMTQVKGRTKFHWWAAV